MNFCKICLISFLFPVFIVSVVFACWSIYPFGKFTVLTSDLYHQYMHFYSYLNKAILGGDSLLYSWNAGFGSNFIGNIGYYASSPFLFIILLFDKSYLAEAIAVLILFKLGLCGLTISILLQRNFHGLQGIEVIIFSSFYALMSYSIVYFYNVMWLDGLIWLPLVVLSINILIKEKKVSLLILFLSLLFLSNFYIAYMVGLFTFLYFITGLIAKQNQVAKNERWLLGVKFLYSVLIAAGISAILTLPTYFQIKESESVITNLTGGLQFSFLFLLKLFSGIYDSVVDGTPNMYVGNFVWLLVPLFFLSNTFRREDKLRWGTLGIIVLISMIMPTLNIIWHGFDSPNGFPYRYSFLFSFILLYISVKVYQDIEKVEPRYIKFVAIMPLLLLIIDFVFFHDLSIYHIVNLISIVLFYVILSFKYTKKKMVGSMLFLLYALVELTFNSTFLVFNISEDIGGISRNHFIKYEDYHDAIETLGTYDSRQGYRVDTYLNETLNDSLHLGYKSLSHSSSMISESLSNTLKSLGFSTRKANYSENGSTFLTDSLFSIKYKISKEDPDQYGYQEVQSTGNLRIYENRYAMPLGFTINDTITKVDVNQSENPFELQNTLAQAILIQQSDVFTSISPIQTEYKNIAVSQELLMRVDPNQPMIIRYRFFIEDEEEFYTLLSTSIKEKEDAIILVNDKQFAEYPARYNQGILHLGKFENEEVTIELRIDDNQVGITQELFYKANPSDYLNAVIEMRTSPLLIKQLKGNQLLGEISIHEDNQVLFLSVPWDKGWNIKVDGQTVKPLKIMGAFIGIPLSQGEYEISMKFIPKGFKIGMFISMISIILFVVVISAEYIKKLGRQRRDQVA